jgi:hypothetical protein
MNTLMETCSGIYTSTAAVWEKAVSEYAAHNACFNRVLSGDSIKLKLSL